MGMFTTNDTIKMIDEYPSREITLSQPGKYKQKLMMKKAAAYKLIVDESEYINNASQRAYGSFGAKHTESESGITCNATYGHSFNDLDREASPSFSVNKEKQPGYVGNAN